MRNFLHAGLDFSGAWKEKGWECSREPGQIGKRQHYSFLLGGESSPLCFPHKGISSPMGLLGYKQQEPCEKRQGVSKACERGSVFWDVQCLAIGPLAPRCFKHLLSCFLFLSHLSETA